MNSDTGDANKLPDMGPEPDPPFVSLKEVEQETSPDFSARVLRRIHRRSAASQFAGLSWHLSKVVLLEMMGILGHLFVAVGARKESQK
jgi:hypothetical protein